MATLMYFFSTNPSATASPSSALMSIDADSSLDAVHKLMDSGSLPTNWQSLWAHVLVWTADNGKQRGFESICLASVFALAGQLVPAR
jgi:hypothetical protein